MQTSDFIPCRWLYFHSSYQNFIPPPAYIWTNLRSPCLNDRSCYIVLTWMDQQCVTNSKKLCYRRISIFFLWREGWKVHVISAIDDFFYHFFDQLDPTTATPMEEVCEPQGELCLKINLIWSHFMRISWSANELFSYLSSSLYCYSLIFSVTGKNPETRGRKS